MAHLKKKKSSFSFIGSNGRLALFCVTLLFELIIERIFRVIWFIQQTKWTDWLRRWPI